MNAKCHPDRKHHSHGLCSGCQGKAWREAHPVETRWTAMMSSNMRFLRRRLPASDFEFIHSYLKGGPMTTKKIHKPLCDCGAPATVFPGPAIGIQCAICRLVFAVADEPFGAYHTLKGSPKGAPGDWLCPDDSDAVNADRAAEKKAPGRKAQKRRPATKQGK